MSLWFEWFSILCRQFVTTNGFCQTSKMVSVLATKHTITGLFSNKVVVRNVLLALEQRTKHWACPKQRASFMSHILLTLSP